MLFVQEFQSKFTKKISTKKKSKNKIQGRHYLPNHLRLSNFALAKQTITIILLARDSS